MADSKAFSVDTTAPTTSISDVQVSGATATVSFSSAASDVERFECRVDGDAFAACTSPKQFTALAEGAHTAYVRAVDNDGNVGAADSKTFTVDTTAPSTSISDVQLSGTAATVSFSSLASDVERFECRVDADAYATCTSPAQLTGLVAGAHTISVRSVDHAGNTGDADTRAFTVDAAPIDAGTVAAPEPSGAAAPRRARDKTAPKVSVVARSSRVSKTGAVSFRVGCPKAETSCKVTVQLKRGSSAVARKTVRSRAARR